jgi:hypothetical protein
MPLAAPDTLLWVACCADARLSRGISKGTLSQLLTHSKGCATQAKILPELHDETGSCIARSG